MDDETFTMMCAWYGKSEDDVREYLEEKDNEPAFFNPYAGFSDEYDSRY